MAMVSGIAAPGRPGRLDRRAGGIEHQVTPRRSIMVSMFILSTLIPVHFWLGTAVIHSYRVVLLLAFVPSVLLWLQGSAGKIRFPDLLFVCFVIWATIALARAHGAAEAVQPAGVLLIETFGAYLLARVYVRNETDFLRMVKLLLWIVVVLVPIALIESMTSQQLVLDLLRPLAPVHADTLAQPRWGLERAQTVFPHPIHFGVFCASVLGLACYSLEAGRNLLRRSFRVTMISVGVFLSLSTGALTAFVAQLALIGWDKATFRVNRRWAILGGLALTAYVAVDLLSNRTPFHVFVTYLTFNMDSAYNRIHIWNYGTAEVLRHPFFGIGLNEWERAHWMSASMDNFWLLTTVQYGLPAFVFLAGAVLWMMFKVGHAKLEDDQARACRAGLLVSLAGIIIAGTTVHFWHMLYPLFMFLLGSGAWLLDHDEKYVPAATRTRQTGRSRALPVASPGLRPAPARKVSSRWR
jgi:hypothetical protein